jgi:hypothetical protein
MRRVRRRSNGERRKPVREWERMVGRRREKIWEWEEGLEKEESRSGERRED